MINAVTDAPQWPRSAAALDLIVQVEGGRLHRRNQLQSAIRGSDAEMKPRMSMHERGQPRVL
ncbi:hypothetical protein BST65_03520 [Bradyrhizobium canariense]|nr:hypothetical protein BST65_03520 [Bradyrhizobium canariense]OSI36932.1 hypothetical protein BST66_04880 [Bradyrhizobium canariense]OSI50361.1 hypothetical protein BSZ20_05940 [Bradyrhizobium canariense]OSI55782.1 hypothetical protein BST67_04545 [Bradyrhizobium canariense]OSI59055.1 hypothetical protein BSZ15_06620 [Bradyrhizobium canariense]